MTKKLFALTLLVVTVWAAFAVRVAGLWIVLEAVGLVTGIAAVVMLGVALIFDRKVV